MKLWIRSQDREMLLQVETLRYYKLEEHQICAEGVNYPLGKYASKARCIEVLDEIQKLLLDNNYISKETHRMSLSDSVSECYYTKELVYQMPLE